MKTSSTVNYQDFAMKREYLEASINEPHGWIVDAPNDYGSIDAPMSIPAGSTYSYSFGHNRGFTDMPTSTRRGL
jgi:hypothetical protein